MMMGPVGSLNKAPISSDARTSSPAMPSNKATICHDSSYSFRKIAANPAVREGIVNAMTAAFEVSINTCPIAVKTLNPKINNIPVIAIGRASWGLATSFVFVCRR